MNAASLLSSSLVLLQIFLDTTMKANQAGKYDQLIADVQGMIAKLQEVHGTDVTWQQLNDLRVEKQW